MNPAHHILPNGLTLLIQPVPYAPVAASVIAYRAAPLWESESTRGLSHFCEHMMFRGTGSISGTRFWQIIQRDGGVSNAFTSRDMTAYYAVVPNGRLDDILRIEADRMTGCTFDPGAVATEKRVVLDERMMTSLDSPSGALTEELYRTAFTTHPYGHPVTGYTEDIEGFERDSAYGFYRTFYTPSNCIVVLTGRIDPGQALDMASAVFGGIPVSPADLPPVSGEPPQTSARESGIDHRSSISRIQIGFRATEASDPLNPFLDLVTMYLAGGRTGRLEESLVQSGMTTDVYASNDNSRDPGLFSIEAGLVPGTGEEDVLEVISGEIARLADEPLPAEQVAILRRRYAAMQAMTVSSPAGLALEYAMGWGISDDPFSSSRTIASVGNASPDELRDAVREILVPERSTVVRLRPGGTGVSVSTAPARSGSFVPDVTPPSLMEFDGLEIDERLLSVPQHSISDGAVEELLPNGLKILMRPDHTFPLVSIAFAVPMGSGKEPPGLAGLTAVTAETMHYGTGDTGYMEFNGRIESIGAELRFGCGSEHSTGQMTMLSDDVGTGLEIIDSLLRRPAFREDDIAQVLKEARAEVHMRGDIPFAVSLDRLARMMTLPEEMARIPTEDTLSGIGRTEICEFHRSCVRPAGSVLVVVGDFSPELVSGELHRLFGNWQEPDVDPPAYDPGMDSTSPGTSVATMEGMTQTAVTLGFPAPARDSDDRTGFHLLNAMLGDGIGSRLGRRLRGTGGLAYSVGSEYYTGRSRGRLLAYLSTAPGNAWKALDAMKREIDLLVSAPVDPVELRLARASSMGRHALGLMHYPNVASYLLLTASTGRPMDQDLRSLRRIAGMDEQELRDVALRWLGESEPFISLAGDLQEETGQ
jgi:zinc protease